MKRRIGIVGNAKGLGSPAEEILDRFHLSSGETLLEASRRQVLVVVFLRHFGCTFTRQILRGLERLQEQASQRGARLVLVHMLKRGDESRYFHGGDVSWIADTGCQLYRAFGLGRGGLMELFGPRVWLMGALSLLKGCGVGHLAGDGLQMPGAFLLREGKILAAQRAKSAADMPDIPAFFDEPQTSNFGS
ncbi:MAG: AhpC/TSA family protein [Luteolibacter sp.]